MSTIALSRLTRVELRKLIDTRAGFWLQVAIAGLMVAVATILCITADPPDLALDSQLPAALAPAFVLLPIAGILLVTSEWSQRTAMITFALVPRRERVLVAKLLAGLLVSVAACAVALPVAAIATAASGGAWTLGLGFTGQVAFELAAMMGMGMAFGAVIRASAPAIVAYFALPTAWSALGAIHALHGVAPWLDTNRSLDVLTNEGLASGTEWARIATSLALWLVLPLLVGAWRLRREDVPAG
jgi:ABC-type transport system involved in multi-copper enzyme maturation permease subunit